MSTRGAIARKTPAGFSGVYHHWDSNPGALGASLFELLAPMNREEREKMVATLIDEHPAGWSTINGTDWAKAPGFGDPDAPECYCHGERSEDAWEVTHENASSSGCEYAYVIDPAEKFRYLDVYVSYCDPDGENAGQKMVGAFGYGDPEAVWERRARVDLNGEAPNWAAIEEAVWA